MTFVTRPRLRIACGGLLAATLAVGVSAPAQSVTQRRDSAAPSVVWQKDAIGDAVRAVDIRKVKYSVDGDYFRIRIVLRRLSKSPKVYDAAFLSKVDKNTLFAEIRTRNGKVVASRWAMFDTTTNTSTNLPCAVSADVNRRSATVVISVPVGCVQHSGSVTFPASGPRVEADASLERQTSLRHLDIAPRAHLGWS